MSGILNKFRHSEEQTAFPTGTQYNTVSQQQYRSTEAPIVHETVNAPIIQETVRNDTMIEVQPVIHREVDHNVVHHIEKHITEPAAPSMAGTYQKNALVTQTVHTNVINEIQPVIHRERVVQVAERVEEHHMERVVEPTIHTHEVTYETVNAPVPIYGQSTMGSTNVNATSTTKHGLFHRH